MVSKTFQRGRGLLPQDVGPAPLKTFTNVQFVTVILKQSSNIRGIHPESYGIFRCLLPKPEDLAE